MTSSPPQARAGAARAPHTDPGARRASSDSDSTDPARTDLSSRLQSFFSSFAPAQSEAQAAAPDPPATVCLDDPPESSMRPPRSPIPSPLSQLYASSSSLRPSHSRSNSAMNLSLPSSAAAYYSAAQKRKRASQPTLPILRWFSANQPGKSATSNPNSPVHSRPPTPAANPSDSPGPSSPSTPSSALSVLADAFADDPHILSAHSRDNSEDVRLPSRPQAARLPRSHNLHRPSYFSNLTRSTMPTACLSPPASASYVRHAYTDPFEDPFPQSEYDSSDLDLLLSPTPVPLPMPHSPAPAHVNSSPPGVSSLDSLRSIHERSRTIHTSAPQQAFSFPQFPSLKNWFSNEESSDKENHNPMLSEEDQAENAEAEREHIRQKCTYPYFPYSRPCSRHCSHMCSDILTDRTLFDRCRYQESNCVLSRTPWLRHGHTRPGHCAAAGPALARDPRCARG